MAKQKVETYEQGTGKLLKTVEITVEATPPTVEERLAIVETDLANLKKP